MANDFLLVAAGIYIVFLSHMINHELNKNGFTFKFFVGVLDVSITMCVVVFLHSLM